MTGPFPETTQWTCPDCEGEFPAAGAAFLRSLARDPHARAVLAKAFREAPMANAAEALHALADDIGGAPRCMSCRDGANLAPGWECSGCGRNGDVGRETNLSSSPGGEA